jgi:hypothetical protein
MPEAYPAGHPLEPRFCDNARTDHFVEMPPVARLLETGLRPARMLPVTFTNVAAEDLQRELLQVGVDGCRDIRGYTLHALGMRILRRKTPTKLRA